MNKKGFIDGGGEFLTIKMPVLFEFFGYFKSQKLMSKHKVVELD
jgi:hypothetical protein